MEMMGGLAPLSGDPGPGELAARRPTGLPRVGSSPGRGVCLLTCGVAAVAAFCCRYGVAVQDFTGSWRSGMAFLAVIKAIDPSLVDMKQALEDSMRENLEKAFSIAHEALHIPRLLEPEGSARSFSFLLVNNFWDIRCRKIWKLPKTLMKTCLYFLYPCPLVFVYASHYHFFT